MAVLFNITHDANNLDEYDSTVTDGGDLSTGTPGLAGTTAKMQALIDDTTVIYGQKDFTQITSAAYRFRLYIDPNTITIPSFNSFFICDVSCSGGQLARVLLYYQTGYGYRLQVSHQDDDYAAHSTSFYSITDAEHYVEVLVTWASSALAHDATVTLWIDGDQKEQLTGLDIFNRGKPNRALLGATAGVDAGTAGTLYLDEFVLRDDDTEIGPVAAPAIRIPRYGFTNFQVPGIV